MTFDKNLLDVTYTIHSRPNNLSLVCLKCPNNKKKIYNDKYRHKRDRLFGLLFTHERLGLWANCTFNSSHTTSEEVVFR